jgi:uncharacterized delta-60 repeat protein
MLTRAPILRLLAGAALTLALLAAPARAATPAPGALDPAFGTGGYVTMPIGTFAAGVASALEGDGDTVTAGAAIVDGRNVMLSTRLKPDGSLDPTYGTGGVATIPIGVGAGANAIAIQRDGRILLAGTGRDPVTATLALAVVRLNTDGSLDQRFGSGGRVTIPVGSVAIANAVGLWPDGRIILGGSTITDHKHFVAARLTPGGRIDTSFGQGGVTIMDQVGAAWGRVVQRDGKVVLAGQGADGPVWAFMAARLGLDGTPDPTFGRGGVVTTRIGTSSAGLAVALDAAGRILITGPATWDRPVVATIRLQPDGSPDTAFGSNGVSMHPGSGVNAMTLQDDGRILLAGVGAGLMRLNADGTPDTTFGTRGFGFYPIGTKDAANGVVVNGANGTAMLTGAATIDDRIVQTVIRVALGATAIAKPTKKPNPLQALLSGVRLRAVSLGHLSVRGAGHPSTTARGHASSLVAGALSGVVRGADDGLRCFSCPDAPCHVSSPRLQPPCLSRPRLRTPRRPAHSTRPSGPVASPPSRSARWPRP